MYKTAFIFLILFSAGSVLAQTTAVNLGFSSSEKQIQIGDNKPVQINGDQEEEGEQNGPQKLLVNLTDDHSFEVLGNDLSWGTFYDFNNEYITRVDRGRITSRVPLCHVIDYRVAEYDNRKFLANMLASAKAENPFGHQVDNEAMFGVEVEETSARPSIQSRKKKDTVYYSVENVIIAKVSYTRYDIIESAHPSWQKYLTYQTGLHPSIQEEVVQKGRIPAYLEWRFRNMGLETIRSLTWTGYSSNPKSVADLYDPTKREWETDPVNDWRSFVDSIHREFTLHPPPHPDTAAVFTKADAYLKADQRTSALLTLFHYLLRTGDQPVESVATVAQGHEQDSTLGQFLAGMSPPRSENEAKQKIMLLDDLITRDLPMGSVMHIFAANHMGRGNLEALDRFYQALKEFPLIAGAYVDAGKLEADRYNFRSAWVCYDIAARIFPGHPMLEPSQARKQELKAEFPQYFKSDN